MPNPKLETYKNKATGDVYDYTDADAQGKLTAILDGTTIDSFGDVETALDGKVDKVTGKGLSTNDYDDTEKAKVAGAFPRSEQAVLGAKNLADPNKIVNGATSQTATANLDGDGIVTVNKSETATANAYFLYMEKAFKKGSYLINGCEGGSDSTYRLIIRVRNADNTQDESSAYCENGEDGAFTVPADGRIVRLYIEVNKNATLTNKKFYPQIRLADDPIPDFIPYAMTNEQLTKVAGVVSNLDMSKGISSSGAYTDLNNVKTSGIYAVFGSALNKPADVSTIINGTLIVTHKTSLDDVTQTLINGNEGTIYVRTYATATGWSSWYKFTGTVVS